MSRIAKKFIKFGTAADEVNAQVVPANYTPTNYTPVQVGSEGTDKISAHLKGINTALASSGGGSIYDIGLTTFIGTNNVTNADVTGLLFPTANVRTFKAYVSVTMLRSPATNPFVEAFEIIGTNNPQNGWAISVSSAGDDSVVTFAINSSSGQVQYTAPVYVNFSSLKLAFRAQVTEV